MAKTAKVVAHVEGELKATLNALAKSDGRTLSTYVARVLEAHVARQRPVRSSRASRKTKNPG